VLRKYRKQGVGKQVAFEVFNQLPAKWEVRVIQTNLPAQQFWRKVIADYTKGAFQETVLDNDDWTGPVFSFDNRKRK
jgi:predicted acetyltransferase